MRLCLSLSRVSLCVCVRSLKCYGTFNKTNTTQEKQKIKAKKGIARARKKRQFNDTNTCTQLLNQINNRNLDNLRNTHTHAHWASR